MRSSVTLVGLSGGMVVDSDDLTCLPPERLRPAQPAHPHAQPRRAAARPAAAGYARAVPRTRAGRGRALAPGGAVQLAGLPGEQAPVTRRAWDLPLGRRFMSLIFGRSVSGRRLKPNCSSRRFPPTAAACCACAPLKKGNLPCWADTLHITQGLEIAAWQAAADRLEFCTLDLGRKVRGSLWLALPGKPVRAACNEVPLEVMGEGDDIFQLPLNFNGQARVEVVLLR